MNNFCQGLADSLRYKFEIEVDVFCVNKEKNCAYEFHEAISFI